MNETKRIRAGRFTVCLDTNKASDETYMNWIQFRLIRLSRGTYNVQRKSNAEGNGQIWTDAGYVTAGNLRLNGREGITVACGTILARYFGLEYGQATTLRFPYARVFNPRGRKGAAPSLLRETRDKNRNMAREKANAIDIATAMATRQG